MIVNGKKDSVLQIVASEHSFFCRLCSLKSLHRNYELEENEEFAKLLCGIVSFIDAALTRENNAKDDLKKGVMAFIFKISNYINQQKHFIVMMWNISINVLNNWENSSVTIFANFASFQDLTDHERFSFLFDLFIQSITASNLNIDYITSLLLKCITTQKNNTRSTSDTTPSATYFATKVLLHICNSYPITEEHMTTIILPIIEFWIVAKAQTIDLHHLILLDHDLLQLKDCYRTILMTSLFQASFIQWSMNDGLEEIVILYLLVSDPDQKHILNNWLDQYLTNIDEKDYTKLDIVFHRIYKSMARVLQYVSWDDLKEPLCMMILQQRLQKYLVTQYLQPKNSMQLLYHKIFSIQGNQKDEKKFLAVIDGPLTQLDCILSLLQSKPTQNNTTTTTNVLEEIIGNIIFQNLDLEDDKMHHFLLLQVMFKELRYGDYTTDNFSHYITWKFGISCNILDWFTMVYSKASLSTTNQMLSSCGPKKSFALMDMLQALLTFYLLFEQQFSNDNNDVNFHSLFNLSINMRLENTQQKGLQEKNSSGLSSGCLFEMFSQKSNLLILALNNFLNNKKSTNVLLLETSLASLCFLCFRLQCSLRQDSNNNADVVMWFSSIFENYKSLASIQARQNLLQLYKYEIKSIGGSPNERSLQLLMSSSNGREEGHNKVKVESTMNAIHSTKAPLWGTSSSCSETPEVLSYDFLVDALTTLQDGYRYTNSNNSNTNNISFNALLIQLRLEWIGLLVEFMEYLDQNIYTPGVITENIVTNLIKYGNLWADELIETLISGVTIKEFKVNMKALYTLHKLLLNVLVAQQIVNVEALQAIGIKLLCTLSHLANVNSTMVSNLIQLSFSFCFNIALNYHSIQSAPIIFKWLFKSIRHSFQVPSVTNNLDISYIISTILTEDDFNNRVYISIPAKLHVVILNEILQFAFFHMRSDKNIEDDILLNDSNSSPLKSYLKVQKLNESFLFIFEELLTSSTEEVAFADKLGIKFCCSFCSYAVRYFELLRRECKTVISTSPSTTKLVPLISYAPWQDDSKTTMMVDEYESLELLEYSRVPVLYSFLLSMNNKENLICKLLSWITNKFIRYPTKNNVKKPSFLQSASTAAATATAAAQQKNLLMKAKQLVTTIERLSVDLEELQQKLITQSTTSDIHWFGERIQLFMNSVFMYQSLLEVTTDPVVSSSGVESGKSRSDDYDEGSSDVLDGYFENNKSRKTKRLRSSNRFVDRWLSDEEGNDAFADLEGFIVE